MEVDLLILQLAIIFLPGIIWAGFDASYAAKVKKLQMTNHTKPMATDGFSKIKRLSEGYVTKGGVNSSSRITTRPPAPAPMRAAATEARKPAARTE